MLCFCRTPAGPASYKPNLKTQVSQDARKSSPELLVCFRPFYFGFLPSVPRGRCLVFCHMSFILAESEIISVFTKKKKKKRKHWLMSHWKQMQMRVYLKLLVHIVMRCKNTSVFFAASGPLNVPWRNINIV